MANSLMHYTCYLFVLGICVDRGDGRWKKRDKENLEQDILLFRKLTEKIEQDIENFYDEEYSGHKEKAENKPVQSVFNRHMVTDNRHKYPDKENYGDSPHSYNSTYESHTAPVKKQSSEIKLASNKYEFVNTTNNNNISPRSSPWPKFNDILLAMGKRYDWKNDRWIRVKEKNKTPKNLTVESGYHETHKFKYRTVKINRGKSKRNIVIALSAVR